MRTKQLSTEGANALNKKILDLAAARDPSVDLLGQCNTMLAWVNTMPDNVMEEAHCVHLLNIRSGELTTMSRAESEFLVGSLKRTEFQFFRWSAA